jgi:hypothetical protein
MHAKKHKSLKYFKNLHEFANKTGNAEDKAKYYLIMRKIIYETTKK